MKRHTKKGPRRSAQMPVATKRFVVTDYDGCVYITAGKVYEVIYSGRDGETIVDNQGCEIEICTPRLLFGCSHLGERRWRWATL